MDNNNNNNNNCNNGNNCSAAVIILGSVSKDTHTHPRWEPIIICLLPPVCFIENPCPEQGEIIQIKLSEHTEVLPKADGTGSTTMLVDTVFEMNYSTGQWTRLKKYKPITSTSWDASHSRWKSHTPNFLSTSKRNMFTHTSICIHVWAKSSTGLVRGHQGEEDFSLFLHCQNAGFFEERFCTFCLFPFILFIFSVFIKSPWIPE